MTDCVIHAFTDGRDTAPQMGTTYLGDLERHLEGKQAQIATVHGRYFAMDRDKRWERVARTYQRPSRRGEEASYASAIEGVQAHYDRGVTDEFVEPFLVEGVDGGIRPG